MSRNPQKHLTEKEFCTFVLEELFEEEAAEIDRHLKRCLPCTLQLEEFYTAQEAFPAAQWQQERQMAFVARLRQHIFPPTLVERLAAALQQAAASFGEALRGPVLKEAAEVQGSRPIWSWQSPDGLLHGRAVRERNGDWTFRFVSKEPGFAGKRLALELGAVRRAGVLERVSPTEVGTKIIIPRRERPERVTAIKLDMVE